VELHSKAKQENGDALQAAKPNRKSGMPFRQQVMLMTNHPVQQALCIITIQQGHQAASNASSPKVCVKTKVLYEYIYLKHCIWCLSLKLLNPKRK